jgi:hypothetical protein
LDLDFLRRPWLCRQAKKQARHEYHASRRYDFWATKLTNEMQDRHIKERGDLSDKYIRRIFAKRDELTEYYKTQDKKDKIAQLKKQIEKRGFVRILTGKDRADREELAENEASLEQTDEPIANAY